MKDYSMTRTLYLFDEDLKSELKRPLGRLLKGQPVETKEILRSALSGYRGLLASIGDLVTHVLMELSIKPDIAVVDGKVERREVQLLLRPEYPIVRCINPAGTITDSAYEAIKAAITSGDRRLIVVDGEEDLLTLVVIAEAPPSSIILYGQPGEGVVIVSVDEPIKRYVSSVLARASTSS